MYFPIVKGDMLQPCERILYIRAELVRKLEKLGLPQQEIAEELELTHPEVSQYIEGESTQVDKLDDQISYMLKELARDIREGEVENLSGRICGLCNYLESNPELVRPRDFEK